METTSATCFLAETSRYFGPRPDLDCLPFEDCIQKDAEARQKDRTDVISTLHVFHRYGAEVVFSEEKDSKLLRAVASASEIDWYREGGQLGNKHEWYKKGLQLYPERILTYRLLGYHAASAFEAVQRSGAGAAIWLKTSGIYLQTPKDDPRLSMSLAVVKSKYTGRFHTVVVCQNPLQDIRAHWRDVKFPQSSEDTNLPLLHKPLDILFSNVKYTAALFEDLSRRVGEVENQVLASSEDLDGLTQQLNKCNADLLRLERWWHFVRKLSATIREVIEDHKQLHGEDDCICEQLENNLIMRERRSQACEYGIAILPRRIQNQFSAVYNLTAQRDTRATIRLAEESQKLATASLRDSSSMKTIAGMTLIFLPPTFICSFFSMSFFNFEASGTKSLWVYFATVAPLTVLVILSWVVYNLWRRNVDKMRLTFAPYDPLSKLA